MLSAKTKSVRLKRLKIKRLKGGIGMEKQQLLVPWSEIVKEHPELAEKDPAMGMNWDISQEMIFAYITFLTLF